jgi:hypothetical protein
VRFVVLQESWNKLDLVPAFGQDGHRK